MKKLSLLLLAAGLLSTSCQQAPRLIIQTDVPVFRQSEASLVTISGPAAREWDMFDRADAVMKYNKMTVKDKERLFETIAQVYASLPAKPAYNCEAISTGIWKSLTDEGMDLCFGYDKADWNPFIMYIHPIVITEMTDFFLAARPGSISNAELDTWQAFICRFINAGPDNMTMVSLLSRKDALDKAGITIKEADGRYQASSRKTDWNAYRTSLQP